VCVCVSNSYDKLGMCTSCNVYLCALYDTKFWQIWQINFDSSVQGKSIVQYDKAVLEIIFSGVRKIPGNHRIVRNLVHFPGRCIKYAGKALTVGCRKKLTFRNCNHCALA